MPRKPIKKSDDFGVIIPLSRLLGLMDASQRVDDLSEQVEKLKRQNASLQGLYLDVLEKLRELT